jgi:hypothetical protein
MDLMIWISRRLHSEFIRILFLQTHRETDHFFAASGVQSVQSNMGAFFHFLHTAFSSMLESRVCVTVCSTTDCLGSEQRVVFMKMVFGHLFVGWILT